LSILIDNDIADCYFYIVRVYTGLRTGAGTKSNIGFMLVGEYDDTDIRILDDESHIVSNCSFIVVRHLKPKALTKSQTEHVEIIKLEIYECLNETKGENDRII
jgi:hypothetical protein